MRKKKEKRFTSPLPHADSRRDAIAPTKLRSQIARSIGVPRPRVNKTGISWSSRSRRRPGPQSTEVCSVIPR
ncbi:unnamed protein product [Gadus morhua 'NCC']